MTGKERVRAAINHEPVDRVPLGFYVVDCDTISRVIGRETYVRDKIRIQVALWQGRRDEVAESLKKDTVDFFRKIDIADIIDFKEAGVMPPRGWMPEDPPKLIADNTWRDGKGRVWKASDLTNDISLVEDPTLKDIEYTVEQFEKPVEVKPPDPSVFECVDYVIEHLGQDRYILGDSGGLTAMVLLGGWERGLLEYAAHPEVVRAAARRSVAWQNANDKFYIRPGQDGVFMQQDMATTKGPFISPRMFCDLCFPPMRERVQRVRSLGYQVVMHNCGNNRPIIPMLIEAGVQCYQSIQAIPDMDIGGLKRDFGDKLCLWGGVPVEDLIMGTTGDVRRDVRQAFEKAARGSGFILGPSQSIAYGTKYDNFMAMLDEFQKLAPKYGGLT
jgi:uroporphyrinogen-III decarboxylase